MHVCVFCVCVCVCGLVCVCMMRKTLMRTHNIYVSAYECVCVCVVYAEHKWCTFLHVYRTGVAVGASPKKRISQLYS